MHIEKLLLSLHLQSCLSNIMSRSSLFCWDTQAAAVMVDLSLVDSLRKDPTLQQYFHIATGTFDLYWASTMRLYHYVTGAAHFNSVCTSLLLTFKSWLAIKPVCGQKQSCMPQNLSEFEVKYCKSGSVKKDQVYTDLYKQFIQMLWIQINIPCAIFVMVSPAWSWKLKVFW